MTFEEGYEALQQLLRDEDVRAENSDSRNEAQTRFDLIDRVIKECLGWQLDKIRFEEHNNSGYTDYELLDSGTIAILEAKREEASFTLPLDQPAGLCSISPLVSSAKNAKLKNAMHQVMGYASTLGTATCLVSNGNQWVAFIGSRTDNVPPLEGKCLVFPSIQAISDDFVTFYNCFSQDGLINKRLFAELSLEVPVPPAPLSAHLSRYPGLKRRNTVQTNLQFLGQTLLEDVPREKEYSEVFLSKCYATSGALSAYAQLSKEILSSRHATGLQDIGAIETPASTKRGVNPELSAEALSAAASHRPIVLLGGVGVGKSTFIHHLVEVDAKNIFDDAIAVRVDYGSGATFTGPSEFAIREIDSTLREKYNIDVDDSKFVNDVYRKELERFDKGVVGQLKETAPREYSIKRIEYLEAFIGDRAEHLRRSVARITSSRRRQVVIFLDNIDQRGHEDQNQVFVTANEIAKSWNATVFVTLRPETYYESRRYGAVSGYHPRVFSIAPPRSDVMLRKRVQFALDILNSGTDARTSSGVGIESENLELFLKVLDRNLSHNTALTALLDNLAGGNMRRALEFVTQFIGSGHIDTAKIIEVERRTPGEYFIPLHEFLRSLLHGDGEYYDAQTSPIANLYSLDRPTSACHFLAPIALHHIRARGESKDSSGYIELADLYRYLQSQGYAIDAVDFTLRQLSRHKLIEAPLEDFDPAKSDRLRITTIGGYTLTSLPRLFTYNDAVIVDTPVLDAEVRSSLFDPRSLTERLSRVAAFRRYLDQCWAGSELNSDGWEWPTVSAALESDLSFVARKARVEYS